MIRTDSLPEMADAWAALARDAAGNLAIQIDVADWGGTRTQADTTTIMRYRDQDYAIYAAAEKKAGRVPLAINVFRRIAPYGSSYHNFGAARDAKIVSKPAGMTTDAAISKLRGIAARNGLRVISNDPLHFELPITLEEAARRWDAYKNGGGSSNGGSSGDDGGGSPMDDSGPSADEYSSDDTGWAGQGGDIQAQGNATLFALIGIVLLGGGLLLYRRFTT